MLGKLNQSPQEARIYTASLDVVPAELERLSRFLSVEEKARGDRFILPRDREHFIAARGTLRELLGAYLNEAPEAIQLETNPWGKPALAGHRGKPSLHFNLAHSHGMAVYVFSMQGPVGIDAEQIRPEFAGAEIAERYFSATENQELQALPPELRAEGFFLCWTRKEAYIKARGEGLRIPLNTFDVSLTPGAPATLRSDDCSEWELVSFTPAAQFAGACVVPRAVREIRFLEFTPLGDALEL